MWGGGSSNLICIMYVLVYMLLFSGADMRRLIKERAEGDGPA